MSSASDFVKWLNVFNITSGGGGGGGVTSITAGDGLDGGTITTIGTISLEQIESGELLANITGGVATPVGVSISSLLAPYLLLAGGTMSGDIDTDGNKITGLPTPTDPSDAVSLSYVTSTVGAYLPLAGGTMAGAVDMDSNAITGLPAPSASGDAVNLDALNSAIADYLPLTGGTMSGVIDAGGNIIQNLPAPTAGMDATNKTYVDNSITAIASGLNPIEGCAAASTVNLTATYNNGTAGVGATLTNSGTQAALVIDTYTAQANDRLLIKNQTTAAQNGVYVVTNIGSASTNWVLTRAPDFDSSLNISKGDWVNVNSGSQAGSSYFVAAAVTTVGTDPITFNTFFSPAQYLQVANNLSDLANAATARTNLGFYTGTVAFGNNAIFNNTTGQLANGGSLPNSICQGRLTVTSGTPVSTATGTQTTLYFTPYKGNTIALFGNDLGNFWALYSFTELAITLPASQNTSYDVFLYRSSGALTYQLVAWATDTTRAISLGVKDGVLVSSADDTRRYVGTIRTNGTSANTQDDPTLRYVWNYYNRVKRNLVALEATASWTYSVATWRQANSNTANQLDFVCGVAEDYIFAEALGAASNSTSTSRNCGTSIGLNQSLTPNHTTTIGQAITSALFTNAKATYIGLLLGRNVLTWMEYGTGTDTQTWFGAKTSATFIQTGITGKIWA